MSLAPNPVSESSPAPQPPPRRRAGRILLIGFLWVVGVIALIVAGLAFYASTAAFQNRMRQTVVARLEDATGGRVDLKRFGWRLTHLEFEIDDLTIHGREAAGQVPYAHVDRLYVRLKVLSFFRPKIALNYLEVDHPVIHLIVYPDGKTNQPQPKHPATGSAKNQIFDLAVGRTVVSDGLAIFNERSIPFDLRANDLAAQVSFVPASGHYVGTVHAEDIIASRGFDMPVHSALHAQMDVGRNTATLTSLTLQSGPRNGAAKTVIRAEGLLNNFADPHWQFTIKGAIDALVIRALTGAPGLSGGTVQVDAHGAGAGAQFSIDGTGAITGGAYEQATVKITGVTAKAAAHVNEREIAVTGIHAAVAGGSVNGEMHIVNWKTPAEDEKPRGKAAVEKGAIHTNIAGFSLDRILTMVAPSHYRRFGFDTVATGTANVDWTGSLDQLTGAADVTLAPSHAPGPDEVPVTGVVQATYLQHSGSVAIAHVDIHTPASHIAVAGTLGVYPPTRKTKLTGDLTTRNLAEFNPAMAVFGFSAPGEPSPIPATLHGEAQFHGDMMGSLMSPEFSGHLEATDFELNPLTANSQATQAIRGLHFDSLVADASYAAGSLGITAATLVQGKTTIHLSGDVHGNPKKPTELFAKTSQVQGKIDVNNADIEQWMGLTGRNLPVSGTVNLEAHAAGTLGDLSGGGHVSATGGAIDGEAYRSLTSELEFTRTEVHATNLVFAMDGGRVTGNGGYDFEKETMQFRMEGSGFELAHIRRIQNKQYPVSGTVVFEAHGSGPVKTPNIEANLHLSNLTLARESKGAVDAEAHTVGRALQLHVAAHLNGSRIDLTGDTQLTGDYETRAKLNINDFDIDPLLRTFSVSGVRGSSSIDAVVTVAGPLKKPRQMNGDARVSELALTLANVPLRSQGPLHASLQNGTLRFDALRIVGPETDLNAQGTVAIFDQPRTLHMNANGSVNMALVQTLDSDIISSGHVDFRVAAEGTTANPDLTGDVKFTNVNVALQDYINGLSRMNGDLVFNQNRLEFRNVTAFSGGGEIRLGGFVTYHSGLYADLTATARGVRIRYPQGVTSTADADLRFQGTKASMLLSGKVTLTAFSISPDVDFASLTTTTGGVTLPPNPDAPPNRVRLDVRITSAPSLDFQNSFARLAGNVDLVVRGTLAQPTVLGRVTVTEGSATFNGEKFQLQHGEIYFSNPVRIQPVLDITATTNVEDYTITIGLQGTTNKLNPTFRSEPPLSEQDIFSLLAMGRTQEEQQIYSTEEQQAGVNSTADALLGGALNATLSNRIQKLFGGGSVRIDPTFVSGVGNATARITVTEPVSKQATLTYATNVNSTAEQLIQGEWRVTPNFSVLAVRDEAGVFSLIFRLHRRYH